MAHEYDLDLVEVSSNANPVIVKLINYDKYRYELEKRAKLQKANSKASALKEIKLSYKIDEHDFNHRVKRANEFFSKGDKIKISLRLVGRENIFFNKAIEILDQFKNAVEGEYESSPNKLGNQISAIIRKKA